MADTIDDFADSSIYERLAEAGQQAVDEIRTQASDTAVDTVETAVEEGVPHEGILDYVEADDIDVVVMATAGRTGTSRELIGSVTEKVVRASPVPVLAVKVRDDE